MRTTGSVVQAESTQAATQVHARLPRSLAATMRMPGQPATSLPPPLHLLQYSRLLTKTTVAIQLVELATRACMRAWQAVTTHLHACTDIARTYPP